MSTTAAPAPKLPPAWFKHAFWRVHRLLYRVSGGHFLWTPASSKRGWGALHLTTIGCRTGRPRHVILGYLDDGPNLVVLAMNGWDDGHPAWWANVAAHPDVTVRLAGGRPRHMHARPATGEERDRLWAQWRAVDKDLDAYAASHTVDTPVVVFEPTAPRAFEQIRSSTAAGRA